MQRLARNENKISKSCVAADRQSNLTHSLSQTHGHTKPMSHAECVVPPSTGSETVGARAE